MRYAVITDNKVLNIIVANENTAAKLPFELVSVENIPVETGDEYDGTHFYRGGEKIIPYEDITENELAIAKAALVELGVDVNA